MRLVGANDHLPAERQIECLPTPAQCAGAIKRLSRRLNVSISHARGIYARGGADATPLALPELLDVLVTRLAGARAPEVFAARGVDAHSSPTEYCRRKGTA
jgi:hypothetical protein